jgi:multisubunit Na+/H+ antiporter MnhE subunit
MFNRPRCCCARWAALCWLILMSAASWAQTVFGKISGTVVDASGQVVAVVPVQRHFAGQLRHPAVD